VTTLTDRYVWAAVRTVPEQQRSDLEPEIRELVAESIDARRAAGAPEAAAEREALVRLGDPERLAAAYVDRPLTLIGPRYYLDWLRLLKVLVSIVVPIATAATFLAQLLATQQIGPAIGGAVATGIGVTVHLCFWTTLVFVLVERSGGPTPTGAAWTPDHLPAIPHPAKRARLADMLGSLVFLALFFAAIVGQQFFSVFRDADGAPIPFLAPGLWSFWLPWFLGLLVLEAAFAVWLYLRDWSWPLAVVNLLLNLAFTIPAVLLWTGDRLLNPEFASAAGWLLPAVSQAGRVVEVVVLVMVVAVAAWDVVDGVRRTVRTRSARG
jgi:MFS family permease